MKNITRLERVENTDAANKMLALGWIIVTTHKRLFGVAGETMKDGNEYVCFVLGWPKKTAPAYPKHFESIRKGTDI